MTGADLVSPPNETNGFGAVPATPKLLIRPSSELELER